MAILLTVYFYFIYCEAVYSKFVYCIVTVETYDLRRLRENRGCRRLRLSKDESRAKLSVCLHLLMFSLSLR